MGLMKSKIIGPTIFFLLVFFGEAFAYVIYDKSGAERIMITESDRAKGISGICADLYEKDLLPPDMGVITCKNLVLKINLSEDLAIAEVWAKNIRPGDRLFFPFLARKDYDAKKL